MPFTGKSIVITGGTTGIGLQCIKNLLERGAKVRCTARYHFVSRVLIQWTHVRHILEYSNLRHYRYGRRHCKAKRELCDRTNCTLLENRCVRSRERVALFWRGAYELWRYRCGYRKCRRTERTSTGADNSNKFGIHGVGLWAWTIVTYSACLDRNIEFDTSCYRVYG